MSKTLNNCYMVMEIVDDNVSDTRLDEVREKVVKPVIIKDELLGQFILDRQFSWFEGSIDWLGNDCSVFLETDEEDGDKAEKALAVLKKLYQDMDEWDDKFCTYAAHKLTDLANEWLQEDDDVDSEEEDYDERDSADDKDADETGVITEKEFAERIEISELSITPDGDLTLYYNDDDMFWGHAVNIEANIDGEISDADIVG